MSKFLEPIKVAYPSGNKPIFEEWFYANFDGCDSDRELIPFLSTGFWVNHDYGNDREAFREAQDFIDGLDRKKKWLIVVQYDDGAFVDFKDLDVMQFNMSKNIGVPMPLISHPQPYSFTSSKKWFCNFIGSRTHPIRNELDKLNDISGYYVSYEPHDIMTYCRLLHESMFTLCPRGYGANSFRIGEAIQYGSIPVYISDEFIEPWGIDFDEIGIKISEKSVGKIDEILQLVPPEVVIEKQNKLPKIYDELYSFKGAKKQIIAKLEAEYNKR